MTFLLVKLMVTMALAEQAHYDFHRIAFYVKECIYTMHDFKPIIWSQ